MSIPNWYEFLLLAVAAWRIFQLLAHDDILDPPRRYVLRLGKKWEKEGDAVPREYREKWGLFLTCPYCAGAHIAALWWIAWLIWPHGTLVVATPFVLNAGVVALAKVLTSE